MFAGNSFHNSQLGMITNNQALQSRTVAPAAGQTINMGPLSGEAFQAAFDLNNRVAGLRVLLFGDDSAPTPEPVKPASIADALTMTNALLRLINDQVASIVNRL